MIELIYNLTGNWITTFILVVIFCCLFIFDIWNLTRYKAGRCNFVISSAIAWSIGFVLGFMGVTVSAAGMWGIVAASIIGAILVYGGVAFAYNSKQQTGSASSPSYGSATLQSQTNNQLPQPILYGAVKVAGNRIWQADDVSTSVTRLTAFAKGEISDFTDIRLNDIKQTEISGITVEKYLGNGTQTISTMIPGATNAERASVVGGLKHLAYLAIRVPRSDKIDGSYNLTTIAKGRKVRIYTDEDTYTVAYSNNPAWCLLDFLTCYNGGRIGVLNTGERSDSLIKEQIDINSFIESAAYCDEIITSYAYTTSLSGNNNDLTWISRKSGVQPSITYTAGVSASIAIVDNDITVTFVNGVTKASDVANLVYSTPAVNSVVNVYNAENNTGAGLISALVKTVFTADNTSKRFTFNMIFDSNWIVRDVIEEFKKNCRGSLTYNIFETIGGGLTQKLCFDIDKPKAVSKVFTKADIIQGSETVKTLERQQRYDILDIKYIEPNISDPEAESGEWAKCVARATLDTYFNEPAVSHEVEAYSVTNFKQASRLAWYYVNRNIRCYFEGSFSTGHQAMDVKVGDVITLSDFVMNFSALAVKVASVQQTQEGVFTISWFQYDADIYNDELASLDPIIIYTTLNDPYAYPADVQSFNASQNQTLVEFNWTAVDGALTYEIKQGLNWDNATVIATGLTGTSYSTNLTQRGTFTYWIKAKTQYQYSQNAISDILNVQYIPSLNIVVSQDIFQDGLNNKLITSSGDYLVTSSGEYLVYADENNYNCYIYRNKLKLNPTTLWQLSTDKWLSTGSRYYADGLGNWGSNCATSGIYASKVYDIGAILENIVSFNYDVYLTDSNQSVTIWWKYSSDGINWSDYTLVNTGSFTFRYYQVKVVLTNPNGSNMNVSNLIVTVDVPDREENYTNRNIAVAGDGITITYAIDSESKIPSKFIITEPNVLVTPNATNAYAVVTSSTSEYCIIKLYDNAGALTTGNINIRVRGY